ncbi:chemotaxis protein CheB [Deinococcus sp. HMF7620]|uniref:protein-glutamate methylesterase n=1 Tax=Deinococcus arboris TaxID=2682977 RepID=A0A7C9LRG1_9DEIO|nr:chemotaxis protein CheB [Deinococcus arboris]
MTGPPLVVIGGSAGALGSLLDLAAGLPDDFPAALLVVVHIPPDQPSVLPELLNRAGPLPAKAAEDGERLRAGHIYVAPPDHHLLVRPATLQLSRGPRENRSRPSIDVLFRSAAYSFGPRTAGVILSGMQDDGTSGLWAIKQFGGTAIVQRPEEAQYPDMPLSAVRQVEVDDILPVHEIASRLVAWADTLGTREVKVSVDQTERRRLGLELGIAGEEASFEAGILNHGPLSPFTCPECHGVMMQIKEGRLTRFRCHTGHAFTSGTLISGVRQMVEDSMWSTVRALDEQVMLLAHLGKHLREAGQPDEADHLHQETQEATERMRLLRRVALWQEPLEAAKDRFEV